MEEDLEENHLVDGHHLDLEKAMAASGLEERAKEKVSTNKIVQSINPFFPPRSIKAMAASKSSQAMVCLQKKSMTSLASISCQDVPVNLTESIQMNLQWWKTLSGARSEVLNLLQTGLNTDFPLPPQLSLHAQEKTPQQVQEVLPLIKEYLAVGALQEVSLSSAKHLIPWFVIKKLEILPSGEKKEKMRLISDCREINHYFSPSTFKMDHLQTLFPFLEKGLWAAKIDLTHAYFHLPVSHQLKPYLCLQVGTQVFHIQGAPFGINSLPQKWTSIMKVLQKYGEKKEY